MIDIELSSSEILYGHMALDVPLSEDMATTLQQLECFTLDPPTKVPPGIEYAVILLHITKNLLNVFMLLNLTASHQRFFGQS